MFIRIIWTTNDTLNLLLVIVSVITAIYLIKTFTQGQKQTKTSLSINQFAIFQKELDGFISEGKQMRFNSNIERILDIYKNDFSESNGIHYIGLFNILTQINYYNLESVERQEIINDFRQRILFPLFRYYDKRKSTKLISRF